MLFKDLHSLIYTLQNSLPRNDITLIPGQPYNNSGYGLWYDWEAAMAGSTTEGAQGICGVGWHIPSDDDWKILEGALGMSKAEQDREAIYPPMDLIEQAKYWRGTDQGTQLKVGGSSGFEALMAHFYNGTTLIYASSILPYSFFWTSSESKYPDRSIARSILFDVNALGNSYPDQLTYQKSVMGKVERFYRLRGMGYSIRCLKD